MEDKLLEHLKGLPFHYEMNCYEKMAEVDDYEHGVMLDAECNCFSMDLNVKGDTLKECIEKACDSLCLDYDDDCWQVIDDDILISRMEDDDGCKASKYDIERWKKGEQRLWCADYRWEVKICFDQLGEEFLEEELNPSVLPATLTTDISAIPASVPSVGAEAIARN